MPALQIVVPSHNRLFALHQHVQPPIFSMQKLISSEHILNNGTHQSCISKTRSSAIQSVDELWIPTPEHLPNAMRLRNDRLRLFHSQMCLSRPERIYLLTMSSVVRAVNLRIRHMDCCFKWRSRIYLCSGCIYPICTFLPMYTTGIPARVD